MATFFHTSHLCPHLFHSWLCCDLIFSFLYLSQNKSPYGGGLFLYSQGERDKKKEVEKKPRKTLCCGQDLNPQPLSTEPNVLSIKRPATLMETKISASITLIVQQNIFNVYIDDSEKYKFQNICDCVLLDNHRNECSFLFYQKLLSAYVS